MTEKDLYEKIKKLKGIKPSQEWTNLTRHNLTTRIDFDTRFDVRPSFLSWLKEPQALALAMSLLLIFIGGPWLTIKASQPSLPGDLLYSVKRASEGIQTTVASEENKTNLQVEFAHRRLEELNKISKDSSSDEKTEKTKQVVNDFEHNLAGISQYVGNASKEQAIEVAKNTKKIKEDLDNMPAEVKDELAEAEKTIEEISGQVLTVLDRDRDTLDAETLEIDQEILIFLKEMEDGTITTTEEVVNMIKE
ncbi:hypothetical protein KKH35_01440 [Patescibacteria group bacterium]|nr:hypothetical protein [Patescibacteria group bacterium]